MAECAAPQPDGNPPGKQIQIAHSSCDAARTVDGVIRTPIDAITKAEAASRGLWFIFNFPIDQTEANDTHILCILKIKIYNIDQLYSKRFESFIPTSPEWTEGLKFRKTRIIRGFYGSYRRKNASMSFGLVSVSYTFFFVRTKSIDLVL